MMVQERQFTTCTWSLQLFINQHRNIGLSHWLLFYVCNHGGHKILLCLLADFPNLCFFPYLQNTCIAVNCQLHKGIIGTLPSQ